MAKNSQVKPGKAGSVLGLIVGCIFVGIGLFVVIPTFGPFGIFWTLGAGAIAVVNGINVFSQKGVATHTIVVEDDFPQGNASIHSPEERLRRLEDLYQKGLVTREEYDQSRKRILEEL